MTSYQQAVPQSYAVINAADIVPMMPPSLGNSASYQLVFAPVVPAANVVLYCAQLGDIGSNHELTLNYLPYAQQLATGFSSMAVRPMPPRSVAAASIACPPSAPVR